ncbi:MAG: hypothetical protein DMG78_25840 [Acidobacteria bacterium]|nr:MAG: hypothetical protein DMG78_25840 [Acidobacteriota bacterium]
MRKCLVESSLLVAILGLLLLVPSLAMAGGLESASRPAFAPLPSVSSLFAGNVSSQSPSSPPVGPVRLTAAGEIPERAGSPGLFNPDNCNLYVGNYPHIATSMNRAGVKVFEQVNCSIAPSKQYISVALYKDTCCGSYFENQGSNTNYSQLSVGASASVNCQDTEQATTFYGVASAYSDQQDGGRYSAEGQSPDQTLRCGTPGGGLF